MTTQEMDQQTEELEERAEETAERTQATLRDATAGESPPWQREEVQAMAMRMSPLVAVVLSLAITLLVLMVLRQRRTPSRRDQIIRSLEDVADRAAALAA